MNLYNSYIIMVQVGMRLTDRRKNNYEKFYKYIKQWLLAAFIYAWSFAA